MKEKSVYFYNNNDIAQKEGRDIKNLLPQKVVNPNGQVSFRTQRIPKISQFIQTCYSFLLHQKQQNEI